MKPIILCVDDEPIILNSLKAQLKSAFGNIYIYEIAENGFDALALVDELTEDGFGDYIVLIISDWLMPGMKGDELLIQIHQRHPKSIKLLLTGQADQSAINRAIQQANLHRYFKKPWDANELIDCIRVILAQ